MGQARRPGAVRPSEAVDRGQVEAGPLDPLQLRLDGGHDRRQQRQPGAQPRRRVGGDQLRPQPARAGAELRLHGRAGAAHRRPLEGGFGGAPQVVPGRPARQGIDGEVTGAEELIHRLHR